MYRAKEEGRNNFQFYSPMMTKILSQQIELEINLKKAIQNREFLVYYQPQYDGKSDKLIGMEALVRWKHPTMGLVPPAQFILVAKKTEMIVDIDRFVTDEAMAQFKIWQKAGLNPGILSANFSIRSLDSDDFIDTIASYLKKYDFDPKLLKLEISETHAMNKTEEMLGKLSELSALGVSIAIDDFGTGYSSLSYLKKLPVDTLKIDQAFVRGLVADEDDVSIVKAIISLAKNLNLELIAEGVETKEQRDFLVENECINIQGYYYAKPMPTDEIQKILENC
jgi:EAL domain-containing protein (putative c-di-GMP-specific phosphodiesterase class I)